MWKAAVELAETIETTIITTTTTAANINNSAIAIDTSATAVKTIIKGDEQKARCTTAPIFYKSIRARNRLSLCNDSDKKQFMQKEKVFIQIYARILFIDRDNGAC